MTFYSIFYFFILLYSLLYWFGFWPPCHYAFVASVWFCWSMQYMIVWYVFLVCKTSHATCCEITLCKHMVHMKVYCCFACFDGFAHRWNYGLDGRLDTRRLTTKGRTFFYSILCCLAAVPLWKCWSLYHPMLVAVPNMCHGCVWCGWFLWIDNFLFIIFVDLSLCDMACR